MSFADLIAYASGLVAVITGVATFVAYVNKNKKDKQVITNIAMTALITVAFLIGSIALVTFVSHPTVAINSRTSTQQPTQTALGGTNNTVVIPTSTPLPVTHTIKEHITPVCISLCDNVYGLSVTLTKIVINQTNGTMQWFFAIAYDNHNNTLYTCPEIHVPLYLEDPSGVTTKGDTPGTLTQPNPLNTGQSVEEYTTVPLAPQQGVTYTLHISPGCHMIDDAIPSVYQTETFTF